MKRSVDDILKKYDSAKQEKGKIKGLYEEVYEYMMPSVNSYEVNKHGDRTEKIFSSVGEQATDRFVQRIQSIVTPINTSWIGLEAGHSLEMQKGNVGAANKELAKIAELCNVFKDTSNFDVAITEFYYDLAVGTACLLVDKGTAKSPLRFVTVPMSKLAIEEGLFGEVGAVYRDIKLKHHLIKNQWRDAKPVDVEDKEQDIELLETCYKDYDKDIFVYSVIDVKNKVSIVERTHKSNPFIVLRWTKCSGEVYGRGLALKSIKDIKTLNKITEYSLRALAFTIPVFLAADDPSYDPEDFKLKPGAINVVPTTQTNAPSVTQLGVNVTHDITAYNTEKITMDIKRNMLDTTLPNDPRQGLTATEVAERSKELQGSLSNAFGRIISEFLYPLVRRIVEVLQSFGYIDAEALSVDDFNGFGYKIKISTALASQQSQNEVSQTVNALQLLFSFDPQGQIVTKAVDIEGLIPDLMVKMGMDKKFVRSKEEIIELESRDAQNQVNAMDDETSRQIAINRDKEQAKADAQREA